MTFSNNSSRENYSDKEKNFIQNLLHININISIFSTEPPFHIHNAKSKYEDKYVTC